MICERIRELVLATSNKGKLIELQSLLADKDVTVRGLSDFAGISAPEENGATFAENARIKACYYGKHFRQWVIADDSGLQVDALNLAPGVHSARFAGYTGNDGKGRDAANNAKLLELLADVPDGRRGARFCCSLCLAKAGEVALEVDGFVEGIIARELIGGNGFGYDPLFYLPARAKTIAQLAPGEKNAISHRGNAFRKLLAKLGPYL